MTKNKSQKNINPGMAKAVLMNYIAGRENNTINYKKYETIFKKK